MSAVPRTANRARRPRPAPRAAADAARWPSGIGVGQGVPFVIILAS
jgi:hypothetical protein